MSRIQRSSVSLVFVLLLSVVLSGCSGLLPSSSSEKEKTQDGKIVLDFWTFWGSETRKPVIEKIVEDFNKSQDEIKVKHTYLPWGDIRTKELATIQAGNPPDVIVQDIFTAKLRAQKGLNTNLSKFINKESPEFSERFYPQLWDAVTYKGEAYGLPFVTDTRVLFYNKDLFKKAGLDPGNPPETWQELWKYANKLDIKKGDRYEQIGFYPLWGIGQNIWMANADGYPFFNENNELAINDPTNLKTLNWLKKWHDKYGKETINRFQSNFGSSTTDPFLSGKLAMQINTATFYTQIRDYAPDLNFGIAKFPEMKSGLGHTSWGGGFVMEIPKGASHPEASYKFMKYLTGEHAQKIWAVNTYDNVANMKAAKEAANSPKLSDEAGKVYNFAVENLENTVLRTVPVSYPGYREIVSGPLDAATKGVKPPKKVLNQLQEKIKQLGKE